MGAHQNSLELAGAADVQSYFEKGYSDVRLVFQTRQQSQARLSTGAARLLLPLMEARRMPAFIGSRVGIMPAVLAQLPWPVGKAGEEEAPRKEHSHQTRR